MEELKTKKKNKTTEIKNTNSSGDKKVVQNKSSKTKASTSKSATSKKTSSKSVESAPKNVKVLGYNDLQLNTFLFDEVENPKAVVVIVHGMMEHCLRYKDFAKFLNQNQYIVVMSDLRGHGKTALRKELLGFGEDDIFSETICDQLNILDFAQENYHIPIYVFGHSYGSMLTQVLIQKTSKIEKAVVCGTTNGSSFVMKLGRFATLLMSPFKKRTSKGGFVEKMCIKSYEKGFENGNWLTKDEKVFENYQKDEYCGGSFPFSFYKSLMKNMTKANRGIDKIGSKKIFLIVGDKDPLSSGGKQVKKLLKIYLKHNVDAKLQIYKDDRHEVLNETNKKEVYQDILDFFEN